MQEEVFASSRTRALAQDVAFLGCWGVGVYVTGWGLSGYIGVCIGTILASVLFAHRDAVRIQGGTLIGERFLKKNVRIRLANVDLRRSLHRSPLVSGLFGDSIWDTNGERMRVPRALRPPDRAKLISILKAETAPGSPHDSSDVVPPFDESGTR